MDDKKVKFIPTYNVSLPEAIVIVEERLDDESLSFPTRTIAIRKVAEMETHNSIKKDVLINALRWLFDHYDFPEVG